MAAAVVQEWLEPDGLLLIESWARDGMTVEQVAVKVGVQPSTLRAWMAKHEEIKRAVNQGRELVDYKVENALLKSALGFKTKEVKVVTTIRNGKTVKVEKEVLDKEFAPSVGAIQTWLYNRRPDKWKPANSKNILDNLDEDTSITIKVERATGPEIQDGAFTGSSSTFEEVDTDWQNDVNKQVTVRGMSEEEKKQQREKEKKSRQQQKKHTEDKIIDFWTEDQDDTEQYDDDTDWGNDVYVAEGR